MMDSRGYMVGVRLLSGSAETSSSAGTISSCSVHAVRPIAAINKTNTLLVVITHFLLCSAKTSRKLYCDSSPKLRFADQEAGTLSDQRSEKRCKESAIGKVRAR